MNPAHIPHPRAGVYFTAAAPRATVSNSLLVVAIAMTSV